MIELTALRTQNRIDDPHTHQDDTENLFTESLTLQTHGAIIHPNIVELNLSGTFGLRQREFQEDTNGVHHTDNENGTITGYDVSAIFLRREKTALTLYAQRFEDTVHRDFGPSFINTTSNFGAIVDIRSES